MQRVSAALPLVMRSLFCDSIDDESLRSVVNCAIVIVRGPPLESAMIAVISEDLRWGNDKSIPRTIEVLAAPWTDEHTRSNHEDEH